jgi:hypothetical protein
MRRLSKICLLVLVVISPLACSGDRASTPGESNGHNRTDNAYASKTERISAADDTDTGDTESSGEEVNEAEIADTETRDDLYFQGKRCTVDCSGHEAGYEWAEQKGITATDDCGGKSQSFIEGCESYVEESYGDSGGDNTDDDND